MKRFCLLLVLAGLGLAASAAQALPVQLVSPRSGARLLAGSEAELEWAPLGELDPSEEIEEWEAFLSLDGGRTYPIRITPHLDQDLRRVLWRVPALPTSDARLLLRMGDEHRETAVELPQQFSIVAAAVLEPAFPLATVAPAAGEPALPGQSGVVAWVEGSRRGGSVRQVVAPERLALRSAIHLPDSHSEPAILTSQEEAPADPLSPSASTATLAIPAGGESRFAGLARSPRLTVDILLLTQRQNE